MAVIVLAFITILNDYCDYDKYLLFKIIRIWRL